MHWREGIKKVSLQVSFIDYSKEKSAPGRTSVNRIGLCLFLLIFDSDTGRHLPQNILPE